MEFCGSMRQEVTTGRLRPRGLAILGPPTWTRATPGSTPWTTTTAHTVFLFAASKNLHGRIYLFPSKAKKFNKRMMCTETFFDLLNTIFWKSINELMSWRVNKGRRGSAIIKLTYPNQLNPKRAPPLFPRLLVSLFIRPLLNSSEKPYKSGVL